MPGRKTDANDCAWLAELWELGLLRARCSPPQPIREWRELTRYRKTLGQEHTRAVNRIHTLLESANLTLGVVAPDLMGASGRAILRALSAGEREGVVLAELATGVWRHKPAQLVEALTGCCPAHQAGRLGALLAHSESLEAALARWSARITEGLPPYAVPVEPRQAIPGGNRQAAELRVAESGVELSPVPSAAHGASWAGVCPGHQERAGKRKTGKTRQGPPWRKPWGVECGWGAGRARRTSVGAQYARLSRRRGKKRAALAVGHSILVAAYPRLRDEVPSRALGPEPVDHLASDRLTHHEVHRLEQLGPRVT